MWVEFNNNPLKIRVGDCVIRAIAKALNVSWEQSYMIVCAKGFEMADMPSSDAVWSAVLREHGFKRSAIPNTCPDCYTAQDFCHEHPKGTYVLGFGGHVATVHNGRLFDSWNSIQMIPQYYFYKED